jgi:hypothetical protein
MHGYVPVRYCPAEEIAVKAALANHGGPITRIAILSTALPCSIPWPLGSPSCYMDPAQVAFVTFVESNQVAALRLTLLHTGAIAAKVIEFKVPPAGWSIDTAR